MQRRALILQCRDDVRLRQEVDYLAKANEIKKRRLLKQENQKFTVLEKKEKNAEKLVVKEYQEKNF